MSIKSHLTDFHTSAAEYHHTMHKTHLAISALHAAMAKSDKDGSDYCKAMAEHHADLAGQHKTRGDWHAEAATKCGKTDELGDLEKLANRLQPTLVSAVAPDVPRKGLTMVPRTGTTLPVAPSASPTAADLTFRKMFQASDDEGLGGS
jgi:hypothetical protein